MKLPAMFWPWWLIPVVPQYCNRSAGPTCPVTSAKHMNSAPSRTGARPAQYLYKVALSGGLNVASHSIGPWRNEE